MNDLPPARALRWSAQRWRVTVGLIFMGQLGLIFWLSGRPVQSPAPAKAPLPPELVFVPESSTRLSELPWLADPSQFALVNPKGFSGELWQRLPQLPAQVTDWTEPPRWLSRGGKEFASALAAGTSEPHTAPLNLSFKPAPVFRSETEPLRTNSTASLLRVEGELAERPLTSPLKLPSWPHSDVLEATTVQVLVDHRGAVLSGVLLTSSGLAAADKRALELARQASFAPGTRLASAPPLAWGRLVFQWATRAPGGGPPVARNHQETGDSSS